MNITLVCTRKVINRYPWHRIVTGGPPDAFPRFLRWYCRTILLHRHPGLLLVHESSLFSFLIYPFLSEHVMDLPGLFLSSLKRVLPTESTVNDFLRIQDDITGVAVEPAQNKTVLGCMNDIRWRFDSDIIDRYGRAEFDDALLITITRRVNHCPWVKQKFYSDEEFDRQLRTFLSERSETR